MIRLLLDEAVSRSVAHRLRDLGIDAVHIGERGRANSRYPDYAVWRRAIDESRILVTINARDFVALARREEIHAGLITFPSGATAAEQLELIHRAALALGDSDLINRWIDVKENGIAIEPLCLKE